MSLSGVRCRRGIHRDMFPYLTTQEQAMNTFCEHHKNGITFTYRCFDRILLNGLIQPFQQPEPVIGFFKS